MNAYIFGRHEMRHRYQKRTIFIVIETEDITDADYKLAKRTCKGF